MNSLPPGGPSQHNMAKDFEVNLVSTFPQAVPSRTNLARAWEWVKDPPPGEGQVGHPQHYRAITQSPL